MEITAKTILSKNKLPLSPHWFPNLYGINLYRGCNHGCIYCDSRSECYRDDHFDQVKIKINALTLLNQELSKKQPRGTIGFGAMTDPYNILEKKYQYTRKALEMISFYRYPVQLTTKSDLVTRDIDILKQIQQDTYCNVSITITTTDDELASFIEPNAPSPTKRLEAIKQLSDAGIYVGVMMMPLLPWITDNFENIEQIVLKAKEYGAKYVLPMVGVTLRDRQRAYFLDCLDDSLRQKYEKAFPFQYHCYRDNAKELYTKFNELCKKHGLASSMKELQTFTVKKSEQLTLF